VIYILQDPTGRVCAVGGRVELVDENRGLAWNGEVVVAAASWGQQKKQDEQGSLSQTTSVKRG
jgi:hypothetical protein